MFSIVDECIFNDFDGTAYLRKHFAIDRYKIAHANITIGPKTGEFDRAKITAEHHTHYRPEEVWEVLKANKVTLRASSIILDHLRKITGVTEATIATFLMYTLFAQPQVVYIVATSTKIWEAENVESLIKILKDLSTPLKSMHNINICNYSELFELQALINRGVGKVDWDQERDNRTKPNVIKVSPDDVYKHTMEALQMGLRAGYKYKTMSWEQYGKSRWEWVPTGSIHSQYPEDEKYIRKGHLHRNKFVSLNMMPMNYLNDMLSRPPEIRAWASIKYEWSKQRAIYGVDVTSATLMNFAMFRCEESLRHRFPVGEEAAAKRVHKRLQYMLANNESLCYDFDDFNAQHSEESMIAVLLAYRDTFWSRMSEEQKIAMEWTIASTSNVNVHNNEEGRNETYKVKGTMMSGWRLTTFMNTMLNYVYFKIAGVLDCQGVIDSVHNGDDVLLAIRDLRAAVLVHHLMSGINARAQAIKCNVYSIGEFLRVEHKVTKEDGLGAQYLSRGVATLVHSRVESQEPLKVTDALKACVTRCEEVVSRSRNGEAKAKMLLDLARDRLAIIFDVDTQALNTIIESHTIVGGAIAGKSGKVDKLIQEIVDYEPLSTSEAIELKLATISDLNPGMNDYADTLTAQYKGLITRSEILKRIINATQRQLAITRKTWLRVTDVKHEVRYQYGRELFREYRDIINIPHLERARFVGLSPISLLGSDETRLIRKLITHAKDVYYTLAVLL
uniref:RNA-directed RNA polymerase n=1 Tax=Areca palm latent virus 1 TaxID=3068539 RepID=A0AA49X3L9_9VIRU|nr:putative RNA-dependent RNA polymerase [Areca palm latent virus 1]